MNQQQRGRWMGLGLGLGLGMVGCASTPIPADKLAAAESDVRGASEVGGDSVPQAALHLKMARDEIARARVLQKDGDEDAAGRFLSRAQADAELALSLTRETQARSEANALQAQAASLRGGQPGQPPPPAPRGMP